ncbi:hypothetical protein CEXT_729551 [Caerostris extrusa]|uniref:Uncharacterized protein n=1 Tax=Caerostris extrusa TaxID=172846 RepID=A0AAV4WPS8_CAEEX|nr:hypothetical protein CEXT_729551 [Caerostris extrusa]
MPEKISATIDGGHFFWGREVISAEKTEIAARAVKKQLIEIIPSPVCQIIILLGGIKWSFIMARRRRIRDWKATRFGHEHMFVSNVIISSRQFFLFGSRV